MSFCGSAQSAYDSVKGTYAEEYALNACKLAGCECTGSAVAEAEPVIQAVTDAATVSTTEAQGAFCDAAQFAYDNVKGTFAEDSALAACKTAKCDCKPLATQTSVVNGVEGIFASIMLMIIMLFIK